MWRSNGPWDDRAGGRRHPSAVPRSGVVGKDFGRFGFEVWPALAGRDPSSPRQNASLERLNAARNAVAHDDAAALAALRTQGYPLVLTTYRQWRRDLNSLAGNLDAEGSLQLGRLFGGPGPW